MKTLDETRIARKEITNAASRLNQRQADMTEQYNLALSHLANCVGLWARGTMAEDALDSVYLQTSLLKSKADPELFRLANEVLEAEMKHNLKVNNTIILEKRNREQVSKYKKLFNAAVADGRQLSDRQKIPLRESVTNEYSRDLDILFAALNDYSFKYEGRLSNPTFQEHSKIDYYPVPDATENTTQPKG